MSTRSTPTKSPEWWLGMLVTDLLFRQPHYSKRAAYVEGRHELPQGDKKYMRALESLRKIAPTNYIGLVTGAPIQRMNVRGFRFGESTKGPAKKQGNGAAPTPQPSQPKKKVPSSDSGTPKAPDPSTTPITSTFDDDAKKIWVANDMDLQSASIHNLAAKYGLSYALVSPPEEGEDFPVITCEDPRTTIIYRDPTRPTRALAGLRMWTDDLLGRVVAVLYLPDVIYTYYGPDAQTLQNMTVDQIVKTLLGQTAGGRGFELVSTEPNQVGEVPIVEYVWKPDSAPLPEGECGKDVQVVQDRINFTILQRIVICQTQAYKQRWVSGLESKKTSGVTDPEWEPSADYVWFTKNPDVKFGEFTTADIRQILEAIRDDVSDIAAITQTPAHYLMGKIANISGETLAQAETGLVKKTKLRMKSMGWSHERTMKLAFAYLGDSRADEIDAEVVWEDPEQNALVDQASAAAQFAGAKIPLQLILERLNFSEEQIQFAVQEAERQAQLEMDAQMEMAKQQAALAPAGPGKPGGSTPAAKKPSPNSTKKKPTNG